MKAIRDGKERTLRATLEEYLVEGGTELVSGLQNQFQAFFDIHALDPFRDVGVPRI